MLINLRNALMTGKRLPYDAEVEYLESTGTQWIEVPMVVDSSATVNITGYVGATNKELFSFDKLGTKQFNIETSATFYRWWTSERINVGSGYVGALHSYKCNSSIWVDGVLKGTSTPTDTSTTQTFCILNGYHNAASGRIYHVSVEYGGRLIFDGIPVRKGTVGYLYDRVSGKLFGNAGTGDFVLGPDVVPVEWLDNGGTAYINTEYIFKTKPRVATNCMINSSSDKDLFGTSTVDASCFIFNLALNAYTWLYYRYGSTSALTATASKPSVGQKMHIDASDKVYIDDALILTRTGTYDFSQNSTSCRIFSARSVLSSRIYDLSMWDGDALVRKYYPVRVGTEGAMMDVLTRRIYRNAGTGAFTYGNDLKYPIPA